MFMQNNETCNKYLYRTRLCCLTKYFKVETLYKKSLLEKIEKSKAFFVCNSSNKETKRSIRDNICCI